MTICLIALVLAVAAGDGDPDTDEAAGAETAKQDAATPYHDGAMERRR